MGLYLDKCHGNASVFLCAGANRAGVAPYEAVSQALGPSGHDGQFYYALARAPWRAHGDDIDMPAGRHVRILYPAICWCLTGGDPVLLLYVMPLVNLLAILGTVWLGARIAMRHGRSPWWGFVLPLALNAGISLLHDFTDCVSSWAVVGLLASWLLGQRWWVVSLWAAAAMLSREQNIAVAGLIGLAALWKGRWAIAAGVAGAGAVWVGWVGILWTIYGMAPFLLGCNFTLPFTGVAFRLAHLGGTGPRFSTRLAIMHLSSIVHLLVLLPVGVYFILRRNSQVLRLLMAGGIFLAVLGSPNIYMDFSSYLRVFIWLPLGIWLGSVVAAASPRWSFVFLPGALWSLVAALRYV